MTSNWWIIWQNVVITNPSVVLLCRFWHVVAFVFIATLVACILVFAGHSCRNREYSPILAQSIVSLRVVKFIAPFPLRINSPMNMLSYQITSRYISCQSIVGSLRSIRTQFRSTWDWTHLNIESLGFPVGCVDPRARSQHSWMHPCGCSASFR